ncbi:MAG TPA: helix-turn-helix transcriptional regulator, partial [Micromonosporaceae bacterium]|nr:helix-turn-helix transcriptional regulator [Micromonosporaceae bacterium]
SRSRIGFSQRDRAVIDQLLPHLRQALRRRTRLAAVAAAAHRARLDSTRIQDAGGQLRLLTRREREVAEHVAGGATDREIARVLGVGTRTVHKHLEQTYRKLGLTNRASLIAALHEANHTNPPLQPRGLSS